MRIWIDLNNPPHVLFFQPIVDELKARGHHVLLTARAYPGLEKLARLMGLEPVIIGNGTGGSTMTKAAAVLARSVELALYVRKHGPFDLALCHGSRSLIIASRFLRIPSLVLFDYEHAERFLKSHFATHLMVPSALLPRLARMGFPMHRLQGYPGQKEHAYIHTLKPDPKLRNSLGVKDEDIFVVLRPPSLGAHYRNEQSILLLKATLQYILDNPRTRVLSVSRGGRDRDLVRRLSRDDPRVIFPEGPLDGLALIHQADLVISGGGTMAREAAALDVPAYSIFAGARPHIDEWLEEQGKMVLLSTASDVKGIRLETRPRSGAPPPKHPVFDTIIEEIERLASSE